MMTTTEISGKKKWEKGMFHLSTCLGKEIHLMREVLTSLHQEELALLERDMRRWKKEIHHLSNLIAELNVKRQNRLDATDALSQLAEEQGRLELFPAEEEASCMVLSQLEQHLALISRINLQNCRNVALFEQVHETSHIPLSCPFPHPIHSVRKKKTSVATYGKKG